MFHAGAVAPSSLRLLQLLTLLGALLRLPFAVVLAVVVLREEVEPPVRVGLMVRSLKLASGDLDDLFAANEGEESLL